MLLAIVLAPVAPGCSDAPPAPSRLPPRTQPSEPATPPPAGTIPGPPATFVGSGDIAKCGHPGGEQTARLLDGIPGTVFTTGDNAYDRGTEREFRECYGPSWGRHRDRTHPTPGNHEYASAAALPYFDYFGPQAGPRSAGFYAYRLGDWEVFSLNSNVAAGPGSPQFEWLASELARRPARCSLAYWHHPVISEGRYSRFEQMQPVWRMLVQHGVEVVLMGHDHNYQRFRRLGAELQPDDRQGMRQFILGIGGADIYPFAGPAVHAESRGEDRGVVRFTLGADYYEWEFVPVAGASFRDAGRDQCH